MYFANRKHVTNPPADFDLALWFGLTEYDKDRALMGAIANHIVSQHFRILLLLKK